MIYLKWCSFWLAFNFLFTYSFAQQVEGLNLHAPGKPALFANLPDKIQFDITGLQELFSNVAAAKEINAGFIEKNIPGFNGKIISATSKYNNTLHSVVVSSTRFNGATLTLSSTTTTDGTVRYSGRIVSFNHDDLYVLQKDEQQYFLIKKKFRELVNE